MTPKHTRSKQRPAEELLPRISANAFLPAKTVRHGKEAVLIALSMSSFHCGFNRIIFVIFTIEHAKKKRTYRELNLSSLLFVSLSY